MLHKPQTIPPSIHRWSFGWRQTAVGGGQGLGAGDIGTDYHTGAGFPSGGVEMFWNETEVAVAQYCDVLNAIESYTLK